MPKQIMERKNKKSETMTNVHVKPLQINIGNPLFLSTLRYHIIFQILLISIMQEDALDKNQFQIRFVHNLDDCSLHTMYRVTKWQFTQNKVGSASTRGFLIWSRALVIFGDRITENASTNHFVFTKSCYHLIR